MAMFSRSSTVSYSSGRYHGTVRTRTQDQNFVQRVAGTAFQHSVEIIFGLVSTLSRSLHRLVPFSKEDRNPGDEN